MIFFFKLNVKNLKTLIDSVQIIKVQILYATFSSKPTRYLHIKGKSGISHIHIHIVKSIYRCL